VVLRVVRLNDQDTGAGRREPVRLRDAPEPVRAGTDPDHGDADAGRRERAAVAEREQEDERVERRDGEGDTVDAERVGDLAGGEDRRLRVPEVEPRQAGEEVAADEFEGGPDGGEGDDGDEIRDLRFPI